MRRSLLFVGAYPSPASLERFVSGDLLLRLRARGWTVWLTSRRPGRLSRVLDMLLDTWRYRKGYAAACVDVFSGPAFFWAEACCALLRRLAKPYLLTLHGGSLPEFGRAHPERVRRLLCSAGGVTCPSPYLLAEMRAFRADLEYVPNALDIGRYAYRPPQWPCRRLIWLRAFHAIYNPALAVEMLARLPSNFRLTMIGPDKGDGSLQRTQARVRELGLGAVVDFTGGVPKHEVAQYLSQADVFVNTTNFDNTPVSVLEAMACGLPVVSTNVGGIPYLLKDRDTALLVPPSDASAMAAAVTELVRTPDLASRLSQNGRRQVEGYDWGVVLPQWEGRIDALLAGDSRSGCAPLGKGSIRA